MPEHVECLTMVGSSAEADDSLFAAEQQDRDDLCFLGRGSAPALERLLARHQRRVFRYIFSRVNDHQTSEDLTQDVFLRLCRAQYDGTASAKTWIFMLVRNRIVDYFRNESRRVPATSFAAEPEIAERQPCDPARNLSRQDEDERIRRWLRALPEEQAEAVRLRIIAGLSFAQTAQVMGCSEPTCKSRVRYGLAKLKTLIADEVQP